MRKLRMGMIGGGKNAFIGAVHRIAANMDGLIEIVCGAFSTRPDVALSSGRALFLPEDRIYLTYEDMLEKESQLPADQRIDFVSIVTPNFAHFRPAMMALEKGFHVVIEKPVTLNMDEALLLRDKVLETGLQLMLTHTYSGYPMVKEARRIIRDGKLGEIQKVVVEYPQGWLTRLEHKGGDLHAVWRTDPKRSGKSGCMADIGTHAAHLAEYISGLRITHVCAQLRAMTRGNTLDDDSNVLLQFQNGATGVLMASQIAAGEENALKIRVYGKKGGIEWFQHEPNSLLLKWVNDFMQTIRAGSRYTELLSEDTLHNTRTPGGHPEGYLEAFANLYRNFALTVTARLSGEAPPSRVLDFPTIHDGVRGMAFIDCVLTNSAGTEKWTAFD
jgi:Predicted dehydrogenases and related proteins